jgi:flavin-dependent dehydrogenase
MTRELDVLVVGAGPAGSATARQLAHRGLRVGLLERSDFSEPRVGESLAPAVQPLLRDLGVWDRFLSVPQIAAFGVVSVWGDAAPESHSYLSTVYGCGYHVERAHFDRMLAEAAREAGAQLFEETSLQRCNFVSDHFEATALRRSDRMHLRARVVVDATGRRAQVARQLGAQRLVFDRAVAVAARWDDIEGSYLLVETTPHGWFYSAPLPERRLSAMLMTDADLCADLPLLEALEYAPRTRARLASGRPGTGPRVHCAQSQRLCHVGAQRLKAGPYLAVGDAALAVDPISGRGVVRALRSARAAADTVCALLESPALQRDLLAAYDAVCDDECTRYLVERAHYYAAEQRYDSEYWRRRAVTVPLSQLDAT